MKYTAKNMWKSCIRKCSFTNYEDAAKRAKKYDQRVYLCPLCGKYHLTKRKEWK